MTYDPRTGKKTHTLRVLRGKMVARTSGGRDEIELRKLGWLYG
jgi:hypothetical protein